MNWRINTIIFVAIWAMNSIALDKDDLLNYPVELSDVEKCLESSGYVFGETTITQIDSPPKRAIVGKIVLGGDTSTAVIFIEDDLKALVIRFRNFALLPISESGSLQMILYLFDQNRKLPFGRFEWNMADGEVAYSLFLPVDNGIYKVTLLGYFEASRSLLEKKKKEFDRIKTNLGNPKSE